MADYPNSRLEAFSDGVFAIAMTLLIIDIKIPENEKLTNDRDLWLALEHLLPSLAAFLISFIVILITWVNHHSALKLLSRSSPPFIYANGLLLLAMVVIPFPTSLVGQHLLSDHAAPAVVLYGIVSVVASIAWHLMNRAALNPHNPLTKNESAKKTVHDAMKKSVYGFILYSLCTILAFWIPQIIALVLAITWIGWLVFGITLKDA
jgi:uncharacterized membrane protein